MSTECLDSQAIETITIFIISSTTLYGLFTIEHKVSKALIQFIQDWFAFYPRWFGINPIIWILYIAGFLDLFSCFSGKFTFLSSISNVPFAIISFGLIIVASQVKEKEIMKNFPNVNRKIVLSKIGLYTIYEILGTGFGLIFGTVALWEYLLPVENIKIELIIMSLIVPNVLSIVARGYVRESIIVRYLSRFTPSSKKFYK